MTLMKQSNLGHASEYARCFDWQVFPLHTMRDDRCSCGKMECPDAAKHPMTAHGLLDATAKEEAIREWQTRWPDANVGIATGEKSGFIALDIDPRHGGDESLAEMEREHGKLPDTVVSLTGGGGRHYLFLWPGEYVKCSQAEIAPGVDIKGDGGYIVAPPSLHRSGQRYEWEMSSRPGEVQIAAAPVWLLEMIRGGNKSNGIELRDEPIQKIYEGVRNSRLASLAGTMRRRGMSESAILAALLVVNEESCVPPLTDREVERIAHSVARYSPAGECPKLIMPKGAKDCAGWLDSYIEYAMSISPMTPRSFHESGGLWLLSTAVARRLMLPMAHGAVYPNLYIVWLAPTTLYRKTTGQAIPRNIADRLFSHLIAPQDCTPEAMLNDMAGAEPPNLVHLSTGMQDEWRQQRNFAAQRGMVMDEMSGILATAGRDYNAGLIEAYLRFYDCETTYKRSTRSQGLQVVKNAYVSILGASTPAAMAQHMMAGRLWSMGWWARFALLTPEEDAIEWRKPVVMEEPPEIVNGLRALLGKLPKPVWPQQAEAVAVEIVPEAQETWENYNQTLSFEYLKDGSLDDRFYGTYGRMPSQALKVAMLLAAVDWPPNLASPVIEIRHLMRAISITEQWRASAHRAVNIATQSEYESTAKRVMRQIAKGGRAGITLRTLAISMRDMKPSAIAETLDQLVMAGDIEEEERKPVTGRPTKVYRVNAE